MPAPVEVGGVGERLDLRGQFIAPHSQEYLSTSRERTSRLADWGGMATGSQGVCHNDITEDSLFRDGPPCGRRVFLFPIASGDRKNRTPTGKFKIDAYSRYHRSSLCDEEPQVSCHFCTGGVHVVTFSAERVK